MSQAQIVGELAETGCTTENIPKSFIILKVYIIQSARALRTILAVLLLATLALRMEAYTREVRTIPLQTGWNLISFQGSPSGFAPQEFAPRLSTDAHARMAAWGYDTGARNWQAPGCPGNFDYEALGGRQAVFDGAFPIPGQSTLQVLPGGVDWAGDMTFFTRTTIETPLTT